MTDYIAENHNLYGVSGRQSGVGIPLSPNTSIFSCEYYSATVPVTFRPSASDGVVKQNTFLPLIVISFVCAGLLLKKKPLPSLKWLDINHLAKQRHISVQRPQLHR